MGRCSISDMEEVNMAEKVGIEDTKELLDFIFSLAEAVKKSAADGKFSWSDGLNFIDPLKKLAPAIDNIDQVGAEILDLDGDEFSELVTYVEEKWNLQDEEDGATIDEKVEDAINAGIELLKITKIF